MNVGGTTYSLDRSPLLFRDLNNLRARRETATFLVVLHAAEELQQSLGVSSHLLCQRGIVACELLDERLSELRVLRQDLAELLDLRVVGQGCQVRGTSTRTTEPGNTGTAAATLLLLLLSELEQVLGLRRSSWLGGLSRWRSGSSGGGCRLSGRSGSLSGGSGSGSTSGPSRHLVQVSRNTLKPMNGLVSECGRRSEHNDAR